MSNFKVGDKVTAYGKGQYTITADEIVNKAEGYLIAYRLEGMLCLYAADALEPYTPPAPPLHYFRVTTDRGALNDFLATAAKLEDLGEVK